MILWGWIVLGLVGFAGSLWMDDRWPSEWRVGYALGYLVAVILAAVLGPVMLLAALVKAYDNTPDER